MAKKLIPISAFAKGMKLADLLKKPSRKVPAKVDGKLIEKQARATKRKHRHEEKVAEQLRLGKAPPVTSRKCALCGKDIPVGQMLAHKSSAHGEAKVVPSPTQPLHSNQWVSIVQGGLPSLGKRSK